MVVVVCLVTKLCPTLCYSMDYSLPVSSVHGILQAKILEWVAISFSRGSSQPKNRTWVSCIAGRFFTNWAMREALFKNEQAQTSHLNRTNWRGVFKTWQTLAWIWLTYAISPKSLFLFNRIKKKKKALKEKESGLLYSREAPTLKLFS